MARHQTQSAHQSASTSNAVLRSRFDESWVEVSSRPSSSSLSSVGDEVITTGLRVQQIPPTAARRNRRLRRSLPDGARLGTHGRMQAVTSSQEEYDESDSESDPVMSSSGEGEQPRSSEDEVPQLPLAVARQASYGSEDGDVEDDDDDDENATAVGTTGNAVFTPQPSAFSHPPRLSRTNSTSIPQSRSRRPSATHQRHSFSSQQHSHSPYSMISPLHQIDHDAALKASLSTLLSYAAAGRGVPRSSNTQTQINTASNRIQPSSIRLMPESMVFPESSSAAAARAEAEAGHSDSDASSKSKGSKHSRSNSRDRRASKKRKSSTTSVDVISGLDTVSPTYLTWALGIGMIALIGATTAWAGYVVGWEAGHTEAVATFGETGADVVKQQRGLGLGRTAAGAAVGVATA